MAGAPDRPFGRSHVTQSFRRRNRVVMVRENKSFAYVEAIGGQQAANRGKFRKIVVGDDREPVPIRVVCRLNKERAGIFQGQGVGHGHVFRHGLG